MPNPKSTASIAGHPIHPMLIPFPVAFFVGTLACDLALWRTGQVFWAAVSQWLLAAGLVMAILAAFAGMIDFAGNKKIRDLNAAWLHAGGNAIIVAIELINFYMRYNEGPGAILYTGLWLSVVSVGILLFTGWMGWEMVYRHRVGVTEDTHLSNIQKTYTYSDESFDRAHPYERRPNDVDHHAP